MDLRIVKTTLGDSPHIKLHGDLDIYSAPRLRAELHEAIAEAPDQLILDLQDVDFLDSSGLGVLVGILKRCKTTETDFKLVCTSSRILKVFELTGLDKVFPIYGSIEDLATNPAS